MHYFNDRSRRNTEKFSVTYEGLIDDVQMGSKILLDDGLIGLEVLETR